jgi:hypothetical protein
MQSGLVSKMKTLTLPTPTKTNSKTLQLVSPAIKAVSDPNWMLCTKLSEQYSVILSRVEFPSHRYCQEYSVYTSFIWDCINQKEFGAVEAFKYLPAMENYRDRIRLALELFVK